ncbi:MAG: prepilin peptidase [Lachnospiraceae bacterium]|nr:prepilin peptidase [Candidatus Darwinimomas equi]
MLIDFMYGKMLFAIFVIVCAASDFRKGTVNIRWFIAMFILTIAGYIWMAVTGKEILWGRIGLGLLSAAVMWLIAILTRQQLGYGDAMFFTATALVLGCRNILLIGGAMILGAFISLVVCAVRFFKNRKIRGCTLPLLPIALPVAFGVMFIV